MRAQSPSVVFPAGNCTFSPRGGPQAPSAAFKCWRRVETGSATGHLRQRQQTPPHPLERVPLSSRGAKSALAGSPGTVRRAPAAGPTGRTGSHLVAAALLGGCRRSPTAPGALTGSADLALFGLILQGPGASGCLRNSERAEGQSSGARAVLRAIQGAAGGSAASFHPVLSSI